MKIEKPSFVIIVFIYLLSNSFMLVNNGWYWDDWCLSSYAGLAEISKGVGLGFMIPITSTLVNLTSKPALFYHFLTGVFELASIWLFYKSMNFFRLNRSELFVLTSFVAVIPYNQTKILMACFPYTLGLFFFILAIYLLLLSDSRKNVLVRVLSLISFFISYVFLPSTLVISLGFFIVIAVRSLNQPIRFHPDFFRAVINGLLNFFDFVLLPFAFWVFRSFFLRPSGVYAQIDYREFSLHSLIMTPVNLFFSSIHNLFGLLATGNPIIQSNLYSIIFIAIIIIIFLLINRHNLSFTSDNKWILLIGLFFFLAGIFPYVMVGLLPQFDGYDSRHQVLLRFGTSFILLYLVGQIKHGFTQKVIFCTLLSLFIIATISRQLQFQKSWFKQLALEKAFPRESLLKEGTDFVIVDNIREYNEFNTNYSFYCFTGILNKSFGTQTRFAVDSEAIIDSTHVDPQTLLNNAFYNIKGGSDIFNFKYALYVNPGETLLTNVQSMKMLYLYYFNRTAFEENLDGVLKLSLEDFESWRIRN